jgi:hypothetical protein
LAQIDQDGVKTRTIINPLDRGLNKVIGKSPLRSRSGKGGY